MKDKQAQLDKEYVLTDEASIKDLSDYVKALVKGEVKHEINIRCFTWSDDEELKGPDDGGPRNGEEG